MFWNLEAEKNHKYLKNKIYIKYTFVKVINNSVLRLNCFAGHIIDIHNKHNGNCINDNILNTHSRHSKTQRKLTNTDFHKKTKSSSFLHIADSGKGNEEQHNKLRKDDEKPEKDAFGKRCAYSVNFHNIRVDVMLESGSIAKQNDGRLQDNRFIRRSKVYEEHPHNDK